MKDTRHAESPNQVFDLSGGALCLDFANTVGDRPRCTQEHLHSYADLLAWSLQTRALDETQYEQVVRRVRRTSAVGEAAFAHALTLREAIFRIFSELAAGRQIEPADLTILNESLASAMPFLQVGQAETGFAWHWTGAEQVPDSMLWPVARSAAELLTSAEAACVRECASDTCSWLFVDRSRTHRRRWCDMKTCGNRAKARRHYLRQKRITGAKPRS